MAANRQKSRNWVFTLNNYGVPEEPRAWLTRYGQLIRAMVWQAERGEEGTPHLQGYIQLRQPRALSWCKKLDNRAHWEVRQGTHEQAYAYNSKLHTREFGPFTYGEFSEGQGSRSDLVDVQGAIESGVSEEEIAEHYFSTWCRNYRALREYRRIRTKARHFKTKVTVIYGPTGSGKSSYAADNAVEPYWKPRGEWWDGYTGQPVVVLDDYYGWLPFDFLLRLLDRYPLLVPTKGGFAQFNSRDIVITSNKHPMFWYDSEKCDYAPLKRRLDFILYKNDLASPFVDVTNN